MIVRILMGLIFLVDKKKLFIFIIKQLSNKFDLKFGVVDANLGIVLAYEVFTLWIWLPSS